MWEIISKIFTHNIKLASFLWVCVWKQVSICFYNRILQKKKRKLYSPSQLWIPSIAVSYFLAKFLKNKHQLTSKKNKNKNKKSQAEKHL